MEYKYKFSIVMPVYNVEEFIEYAVDSVISQDIGFKNVELILVDDGATDKSGEICDRYKKRYPDNVFVIHKPNGGLSSARNAGLERAGGKYVNFMDPDDHLPENALSEVYDFFEKNYDLTDVTALKIVYFDGRQGNHYLNYKFSKKNRVEDLNKNWDCPHLHVASAFFKLESVKNLRFDTRISFAEDGLFSQTVIMEKQTIGLVSSSRYDYRIRTTGQSSLIQGAAGNPKWYTPTLRHYHLGLIKMAKERFSYIPKYLQMTVMYELQWRFKRPQISGGVLSSEEEKEYFGLLCEVLKHIDDDIITAQRYIHRDIKLFVFSLKYGRPPQVLPEDDDVVFYYSPSAKFYLSRTNAYFDFIEIQKDGLYLDGYVILPLIEDKNFMPVVFVNGRELEPALFTKKHKEKILDRETQKNYAFKLKIPLENGEKEYKVQIGIKAEGKTVILKRSVYKNFVPFDNRLPRGYFYEKGYKISGNPFGEVNVKKCGLLGHLCAELCFLLSLLNSSKYRPTALHRIFYHIAKIFKRKPIWVISDRATMASDNGEALFSYLLKNHPDIDARYVLDAECTDFERLKDCGKLLKRNSKKHKLYLLLAEFIISSHAENEIFAPFGSYSAAYKDIICKRKRIFLQHGITKNDVSDWLNKYNKNFKGFVCAAAPEYESIIGGDYFYDKNEVWLTGFPRFDRLCDRAEKRIVIMPTWRKYLFSHWDKDTDVWKLRPDFEKSDYFKFYNSLLNDKRLISAAKKLGYKIDFFPHPNFQAHIGRFKKDPFVNFIKKGEGYTEIYNRSALLLTDYSSAAFDFAYLKKPVLYAHFDEERFYRGDHVCERGYFDDERDGFGEVLYDFSSTVDMLIEYMENGCKLKPAYEKRIENFFAYFDRFNCMRVYRKIIELRDKK